MSLKNLWLGALALGLCPAAHGEESSAHPSPKSWSFIFEAWPREDPAPANPFEVGQRNFPRKLGLAASSGSRS